MPDADGQKSSKDYGIGIPQETPGFHVKGSGSYDWGMKHRLTRMFNARSGRVVMLAFDHGYIMGPTSGLERVDLSIVPLIPYADVLMCTRGILRSVIPPQCAKPVALRTSAGATILTDLSKELIGVDVEDALRLNAAAQAVMAYIGAAHEHETLGVLTATIDAGMKFGLPTLAVTAVGKEMVRDARYLGMSCRVCAELGAQFVKTYYCEPDFEQVTAACPVPVVIAGGKKIPEPDALSLAYKAIDQGAAGVDMGRNIFAADDPVAMIQAVRAVVHEGETPRRALELYETLKNGKRETLVV
jgi:3-hydroxy-5-phosphonooxypentane-2,4-dione thiolase